MSCNALFIGGIVLASIVFVELRPGEGIALALLLIIFLKLEELHDELRSKG